MPGDKAPRKPHWFQDLALPTDGTRLAVHLTMKNLSTLLLRSFVGAALLFSPACMTDTGADEFTEDSSFLADRPSLEFKEIDVELDATRFQSGGYFFITSKEQWEDEMGTPAPESVNFRREQVVVFSSGIKNTGGYKDVIKGIYLSASGKRLTVDAEAIAPGATCLVTQALDYTYTVVKFDRISPRPTLYRKLTESVADCTDGDCAGTIEYSERFEDSADGMSCKVNEAHCVTPDRSNCPQFLPPNCSGELAVETGYVASADGMECPLPKTFCINPDSSKCPQLALPGPNFCPDGVVVAQNRFAPHPDGEFCRLITPVCVTTDEAMCAQ